MKISTMTNNAPKIVCLNVKRKWYAVVYVTVHLFYKQWNFLSTNSNITNLSKTRSLVTIRC